MESSSSIADLASTISLVETGVGTIGFRVATAANQTNTFNAQNQETSAGSTALSTDNNRNQLSDSAGDDFTYDAWNRMAGVTNLASGKHTSYSYNPARGSNRVRMEFAPRPGYP
jgi:hypothetical protein